MMEFRVTRDQLETIAAGIRSPKTKGVLLRAEKPAAEDRP